MSFGGTGLRGNGYWHGRVVTIALIALLGRFVAFSLPGYSALVPKIAGEDNLASANSTMQSVQGIAVVVGPGLGGVLDSSAKVGRCTSTP